MAQNSKGDCLHLSCLSGWGKTLNVEESQSSHSSRESGKTVVDISGAQVNAIARLRFSYSDKF